MAENIAHLAVLALADREAEPEVRALYALERRVDLPVMDAIDRDALAQFVELVLRDRAVRAHAVATQPAGCRQFENARQRAVIGQEKKPLGVEIKPPDADQAWQFHRQPLEDCQPALRVAARG